MVYKILVYHSFGGKSANVIFNSAVWICSLLHEGYCAKRDKIQSIYKGIIPFVILQALGVITVLVFPGIALGLMHFVHG